MKNKTPIYVTRPHLPPLDEYLPYLKEIWESHVLTNNGQFHQQLEKELCDFLGVKYISLFSNGTLALVTALQALRITGEVITTPFSFVATTHSLWWNNIKPVFVDIEPDTCNIDPAKIQTAITPSTTAIMPVHVYGNPCDIDAIQKIADDYNLKVIYDAAHAFGVRKNGESIMQFGDVSVLSFHATKVFNTFEGGAIVCNDAKMKQHIDDLKNFGFRDEVTIVAPGINAKMNEVQAAMGLLQLKYMQSITDKRKEVSLYYRDLLQNINGISFMQDMEGVEHNYAYFPIFVDSNKFGHTRDELYYELQKYKIFGRRYFYPLISQFPTYRELKSSRPENLINAVKIADEVLCLPIYPDLEKASIYEIAEIIKGFSS